MLRCRLGSAQMLLELGLGRFFLIKNGLFGSTEEDAEGMEHPTSSAPLTVGASVRERALQRVRLRAEESSWATFTSYASEFPGVCGGGRIPAVPGCHAVCVQVGPGLPASGHPNPCVGYGTSAPSFLLLASPLWANVSGTKRWGNAGVGQRQARRPGTSLCLICAFLGRRNVPAAVVAASLFLVRQAGLLLFAKNAANGFRVAYREMFGIFRAK